MDMPKYRTSLEKISLIKNYSVFTFMICTFSRVANVSHTDDLPHPDGPEIRITGASSFVPVFFFLEKN